MQSVSVLFPNPQMHLRNRVPRLPQACRHLADQSGVHRHVPQCAGSERSWCRSDRPDQQHCPRRPDPRLLSHLVRRSGGHSGSSYRSLRDLDHSAMTVPPAGAGDASRCRRKDGRPFLQQHGRRRRAYEYFHRSDAFAAQRPTTGARLRQAVPPSAGLFRSNRFGPVQDRPQNGPEHWLHRARRKSSQ